MKKIAFTIFSLFTCVALALEYRSMDIINNSNIPITVTYDECQSDRLPDSSRTLYNCHEKTTTLSEKSKGQNFIIYHNRAESDQNPNVWLLKKIVSSLGEQNFTVFSSFEEYFQMTQEDKSFKTCFSWLEPNISSFSSNVIIDNFGTNSFYCHHLAIL